MLKIYTKYGKIMIGCEIMLKFENITPSSFANCAKYIKREKINEYGIIPTCAYSKTVDGQFLIYDDCLVEKVFEQGRLSFVFAGEDKRIISAIKKVKEEYGEITVDYVDEKKKDLILSEFKDAKVFKADEGQSDYLYEISSFLNLSGKAVRHKRENYNKFLKSGEFIYKELIKENFKDCLLVCRNWCLKRDCLNCEYACEYNVLSYIYENFDLLPVKGAIIYINSSPAAFFIGEIVGDTLMGYHQKTLHNTYTGIGYAIYIEALKNTFSDIKYFNMGPDIGIEGLKQFKRQFKPYTLLDKYSMHI